MQSVLSFLLSYVRGAKNNKNVYKKTNIQQQSSFLQYFQNLDIIVLLYKSL